MRRFPLSIWIALIAVLSVSCDAETLKDLLVANHVPLDSFSRTELAATVQGLAKENGRHLVLAYAPLKSQMLAGPPWMVQYVRSTGNVLRAQLSLPKDDVCAGSVEEMRFVGQFTLMSVSLSPDAECLLVVGGDLKLRKVLYGFGPVEVAPNEIVFIENMVHFAPVHPERLQLANLDTGATTELYPAKDDVLRARLADENQKKMPRQEICAQMNDPCEPDIFDESIQNLLTDGKGRFTFVATQSASHMIQEGQPPQTIASQTVAYVYQRRGNEWRYCQRELNSVEMKELGRTTEPSFQRGIGACVPSLSVVPDLSTSSYNPTKNQ